MDTEDGTVAMLMEQARSRAVVVFKKGINAEVDTQADEGMKARLIGYAFSPKYDGFMATFDFSEFEQHNRPIAPAVWDGKTVFDTELYKPVEEFWITPASWESRFSFERDDTTVLIEAHKMQAMDGETYMEFLERLAMRAICLPEV